MQSPSASFSPSTTRPPVLRLPDLVLWGCYALVLVMLVLAFNIRTLADTTLIVISFLLYAGCTLGGISLLWMALRRFPPERSRVSYYWFLAALVAVVLRAIPFVAIFAFGLDPELPFIRWPSTLLFVVMYGCVLVAGALALPRSATIIGTAPRVLFGSAVIGLAALLITASIPALAEPLTRMIDGTGLIRTGVVLAVAFAVAVIGLRYGRRGGPMIVFLIMGMLCLLGGNVLLTWLLVSTPLVPVMVLNPLYVLPNILIPHGIYRSIERPPQFTPPTEGQPSSDWLFWGLVPRVVAISAVLVALISGQVRTTLLLVLGGVWIAHELLALRDHWRIARQLARARRSGDG